MPLKTIVKDGFGQSYHLLLPDETQSDTLLEPISFSDSSSISRFVDSLKVDDNTWLHILNIIGTRSANRNQSARAIVNLIQSGKITVYSIPLSDDEKHKGSSLRSKTSNLDSDDSPPVESMPGNKPAGLGPPVEGSVSTQPSASEIKQQVDADIESGAAHDFSQDEDGKMKQVYEDFQADPPKIGAEAKALGPKLSTMKEDEFIEFMDAEVATGKPTSKVEIVDSFAPGKEKQNMMKYEYPDGTMVRYKPDGDLIRKGKPTYSIEIKKDASLADRGGVEAIHDVAFKVDEKGRLVPKWPPTTNNPYGSSSTLSKNYTNAMMATGHKILPK